MTIEEWKAKYGTHTLRLFFDRLTDCHYRNNASDKKLWSSYSIQINQMLKELEQALEQMP